MLRQSMVISSGLESAAFGGLCDFKEFCVVPYLCFLRVWVRVPGVLDMGFEIPIGAVRIVVKCLWEFS